MGYHFYLGMALPVLLCGWFFLGWLRDWRRGQVVESRKQVAAQELPQMAARLGMEHEPSRVFEELGELNGEQGSIEPDEGQVYVSWQGGTQYPLHLCSDDPVLRPDKGMVSFDTNSEYLDKLLGTREASPELASAIVAGPTVVHHLHQFLTTWGGRLQRFYMDGHGVRLTVDEAHKYDLRGLEALYRALVSMTQSVEPALAPYRTTHSQSRRHLAYNVTTW